VSEKRVLRNIFGPRRGEVAKEWRRFHSEDLYDLYSSPNTIRMIKSRRVGWWGQERCKQGFDGVDLKEGHLYEYPDLDGKIK
jgi:hypothetical protein